jgi:hypothetical protein
VANYLTSDFGGHRPERRSLQRRGHAHHVAEVALGPQPWRG